MNKDRFYQLIIGVLLAILLAFIAMTWMKRPKRGGPPGAHAGPKQIVIDRLKLDQGQVVLYEELVSQHVATMRDIDQDILERKNQLYLMLKQETDHENTDSLIGIIADLQDSVEHIHFAHFKDIKNLCSPSQLADYDDLVDDLSDLFSKKPPPKK